MNRIPLKVSETIELHLTIEEVELLAIKLKEAWLAYWEKEQSKRPSRYNW